MIDYLAMMSLIKTCPNQWLIKILEVVSFRLSSEVFTDDDAVDICRQVHDRYRDEPERLKKDLGM